MQGRYLYELGQARERTAIERWLFAHSQELLEAIGLPNGWWCGVGLDRRDLFGIDVSGDVDLIAGPLTYRVSETEWAALLQDEASQRPGTSGALIARLAHVRAGQLGLVEWPPKIGFVGAIEVKGSYFNGAWKATHVGERNRIRGQIRFLQRKGVNSVSFLHLAATAPVGEIGRSWEAATRRVDLAVEKGFPIAFVADAGSGYFRALMGAIPEGTEETDGVHDGLITMTHPTSFPRAARPWHATLAQRLAQLPPPRYIRTFIHGCATCERWRHAGSAAATEFPCVCDGIVGDASWSVSEIGRSRRF